MGQSLTQKQVPLSTALIKVKESKSNNIYGCCILDSGSQDNFITRGFVHKLDVGYKSSILLRSFVSQTRDGNIFGTVKSGEVDLMFLLTLSK